MGRVVAVVSLAGLRKALMASFRSRMFGYRYSPVHVTYDSGGARGFDRIYRFLDKPEYADQFVAGRVLVSTLEACRRYEANGRGDAIEGQHVRVQGEGISILGAPDPATVERIRRLGLPIGGHGSVYAYNARTERLPDAHVLCFSEVFEPAVFARMGLPYCVEIFNPTRAFDLLDAAVARHFQVEAGRFSLVTYAATRYIDSGPEPGVLGLVKEPDEFAHQREARMLWWPRVQEALTPDVIDAPGLSTVCRRVL